MIELVRSGPSSSVVSQNVFGSFSLFGSVGSREGFSSGTDKGLSWHGIIISTEHGPRTTFCAHCGDGAIPLTMPWDGV